ncbi:MAG TPA: DEDD exonuclease domain-containing protein [Acidimicrobiales bacterium]
MFVTVAAVQRSFDDLGTPLHEVTFCVVDVETTGGSPATCAITEIGAARFRGGDCTGTLQTLVNPGLPIPPEVTVLTGITEAMVLPAPPIGAVLPHLLEFVGGAVLVGHNLRFDVAFLDAALVSHGYHRLRLRTVDTVALARRLVPDEVPNCRLGTLADRFRLDHRPTHRALDDALATADLLHALLERAAAFGVTGLDDLLALPTMAAHPQAAKLRLTDRLPRGPGIYVFRDGQGRALYVGKATNLRSRVRSYFSGDDRRKVGPMLREAQSIDHVRCASTLDAAVLEVRMIHALEPRYNRHLTRWRSYRYVKLTDEPFPRLAVARTPPRERDGARYVGPLPSTGAARRLIDSIEAVVPLRRCSASPPAAPGATACDAPCAPAQLGVATCPCAGEISRSAYAEVAAVAAAGLGPDPLALLDRLDRRMRAMAEVERYEDAARARDRGLAVVDAHRRQRRFDMLRRAERLVVEVPGGRVAELRRGRLVRSAAGPAHPVATGRPVAPEHSAVPEHPAVPERSGSGGSHAAKPPLPEPARPPAGTAAGPGDQLTLDLVELPPVDGPLPLQMADELACVGAWLDRNAATVRLLHVEGELSSPLPRLPSFRPIDRTGERDPGVPPVPTLVTGSAAAANPSHPEATGAAPHREAMGAAPPSPRHQVPDVEPHASEPVR